MHRVEYGFGTIAIVIVSALALLGIVLLPCFDKHFYQSVLQTLTALAASTIFCDAMLHILPEVPNLPHLCTLRFL